MHSKRLAFGAKLTYLHLGILQVIALLLEPRLLVGLLDCTGMVEKRPPTKLSCTHHLCVCLNRCSRHQPISTDCPPPTASAFCFVCSGRAAAALASKADVRRNAPHRSPTLHAGKKPHLTLQRTHIRAACSGRKT